LHYYHAVATPGGADHVPVIVEHDVDTVGVSEVEDSVQAVQEGGVESVLIARLGSCPHHTEANEVPTQFLDVVNIGLVEG
jgi:hypothetical protein